MHWVFRSVFCLTLLLLFGLSVTPSAQAQGEIGFERGRGRDMLKTIKDEIKKNYYDTKFHGIDLEARFKTADEKMQQAQSVGQIFGIIAQALLDFDDSHTFFIPPARADSFEYGWQMQAIGNNCYIAAVKPGSDAEAKGLKAGDQILNIGGFKPTRDLMWKINYLFNSLRPMPVMPLTVLTPEGEQKQVEIQAKIKHGKRLMDLTGHDGGGDINEIIREGENEDHLNRHRYISLGDKLMIWKMPQFDLDESGINEIMGKAKKQESLILDLRGNGGGSEKTLEWLLGQFFEKDLKIGDLQGRKEDKPPMAKGKGGNAYKGKLVVLIDSRSASASELFARIVQLEKRGTVIGDRSAGAVMRARHFSYQAGTDKVIFYGASITAADLIMADGKSLEKVGVTPDELLLPTPADMAAKRDPALARAAALLGVQLPPEKAGTMFPIEWRKQ